MFCTAYLIWKYIQPFILPHTEGLVLQTKLLKRCFHTHFFQIYVRHREMFGGFCLQIWFTLHEFKHLQSTRNMLCSFTISSHKATSSRRISHVSADNTNLNVCTCAHVHACTCFKGKLHFSLETLVLNQHGALCRAWLHPSVQSQNSEMEKNLHIIFGVFLSQSCSVLCTVLLKFSYLFLNSLWIWLFLLPLGYHSTI